MQTSPDLSISPNTQAPASEASLVNEAPPVSEAPHALGVSRPPLPIAPLPTPEQVFRVKRVGIEEFLLLIAGPGLVSLGIALGNGQWILGPLVAGRFGLRGLGWVILLAIILQVFYNVELSRLTLATGETPAVALSRTWPGRWFWLPLLVLIPLILFTIGGWSYYAGASLFTFFTGRAQQASDLATIRLLAVAILVTTPLLVLFARHVQRTLEYFAGFTIAFALITLLIVSLVIIPLPKWSQALLSIVSLSRPIIGTNFTWFGALIGFAALSSGLNFAIMSYYREKGYAMAHLTGAHRGTFDRTPANLAPSGHTFAENDTNTRTWKRWFRLLLIDQWAIFFPGAVLGWLLPSVLMTYLITTPGADRPNLANISVYIPLQLSNIFGPILLGWGLTVGFVVIYIAQILIMELVVRHLVDMVHSQFTRLRGWIQDDPRVISLALYVIVIALSAIAIYVSPPEQLLIHAANLTNGAALIFPLAVIYLGRQLPRPARISTWSYLVLIANMLFFGFFFINYLFVVFTGQPWIRF